MLGTALFILLFALGVTTIVFTLYIKTRKSGAIQEGLFKNFLDAEHGADFSRKKDPEAEDFLSVDIHTLPICEYPEEPAYARVAVRQKNVLEISKLPMICNVSGMSNRELKLKFGTANLDSIVTYEENYNRFIHNLLEWSTGLIALGKTEDATAVLKVAIEHRCDRSQAYTMLAELLTDRMKLLMLREKAESILGGSVAERTLVQIDQRLEQIMNAAPTTS